MTILDAGIVPRMELVVWRTADSGASHLIMVYSANARRRTSPLNESCLSC